MNLRTQLSGKIHHAKVTDKKRTYQGSIFIDEDWLRKTNIAKYEQVHVINIDNGNRWITYAMPEEAGSKIVSVRGGGAKLCQVGDTLIILAYQQASEPITPNVLVLSQNTEKNLLAEKTLG